MAVLPILTYPDPRLREMCEEVGDFADPLFLQLVADLKETVAASPGCVGVAAPQAGYAVQVLVVDCGRARKPPREHHGLLVVVNPMILKWSGMEVGREGCLSLPDFTGNVVRATEVQAQFQQEDGSERVLTLSGFEARVFQHEMDHLEGKLFIDRVVSRKSDIFPRKSYGL